MTTISSKSPGDSITSADFNVVVNKIQNGTDNDVKIVGKNNTDVFMQKDSGGTARSVIKLDSSNDTLVGYSGGKIRPQGNLVVKSASSDPTGTAGMVYFNTTDNVLKYYNGTKWVEVRDLSYTTENLQLLPSDDIDGIAIDTGSAGNNVYSDWVEVTSSTTQDILIIGASVVDDDPNASRKFILDIGVGSSGSETSIAKLLGVRTGSESGVFMLPIPRYVPSGSRIAVRLKDNQSTGRNYKIHLQYIPFS